MSNDQNTPSPDKNEGPKPDDFTRIGFFTFAGLIIGAVIGGFGFYSPVPGALAGAFLGLVAAIAIDWRKRKTPKSK